jgi:2-polyprenyl-3-methyl-5-hydroxy-6-metoxy-1,4-benzoquinol methylase
MKAILLQQPIEIKNGVYHFLSPDAKARWMDVAMSNGVRARIFYADHYDQDAEAFDYFQEHADGASRHENRRLRETIIRQVPREAQNILDIGCGSAWVAGYFCKKGVAVYSMDISAGNPTRALQTYPFDNHVALVADVYELPFAQNTFDCIIAAEVMEHTPDPKLFISNLLRVLKPDGTLILTTPFQENIVHSLCVHCNRLTPHNAHLHSFNQKNITVLLQQLNIRNYKLFTFSNKFLSRLQTHLVLQYLPFKIWQTSDYIVNLCWKKPTRMLLKIKKNV